MAPSQREAENAQLRLQVESLTKEVGTLERLLAPSEAEADQLRLRLAASEAVALAALDKAKKMEAEVGRLTTEVGVLKVALEISKERGDRLQAEVDQWRKAVRWRNVGNNGYALLIRAGAGGSTKELAAVFRYGGGWTIEVRGVSRYGLLPERDKACAAVCEVLALPEVLPTTPERGKERRRSRKWASLSLS